MPKDNFYVATVVEDEGLGYAIQHYMNGDSFEDRELAEMWDKCQELLEAIDKKLEPYYT